MRETVLDAAVDVSVSLANLPFLGFPSLLPFLLKKNQYKSLKMGEIFFDHMKCILRRQ